MECQLADKIQQAIQIGPQGQNTGWFETTALPLCPWFGDCQIFCARLACRRKMSRYLRNRLQDRAKSLRPHCRFAPPVQISTIAPAIQRSWKGRRKDLDARACKLILGMTWTLLWFSLMPSCRSFSWIFSEGCEWTTRAGYAGYHSSGSENLPALEGHFWDTSWSTPCELACRTRSTVIRKASNLCRVARIELNRTAEHWRRHGCARGTERFFSHSLPETTSFVLIRRLLIIYDNKGQ